MKTKEIEFTRTEIQYLMNLVNDHVATGTFWGNNEKFHKMQDRVLEKLSDAIRIIDPEMKGFIGEY